MAITSSFVFTNATAAVTKALGLIDLGLTNYSSPMTTNTETRYENNTDGTAFTSEALRYRYSKIRTLDTVLNVENPSKAKDCISYGVTAECMLVTTDSADPQYEVDNPVICRISFAHRRDKNITATHVLVALARAISALFRADGTSIIPDLMQGTTTVTSI
jgi:hypothetical protein